MDLSGFVFLRAVQLIFCESAQFHRCVFSSSNTLLYCCRYIKVLEIKRPVPFAKSFLMFNVFVYKFEISLDYVYNNSAETLMGTMLSLYPWESWHLEVSSSQTCLYFPSIHLHLVFNILGIFSSKICTYFVELQICTLHVLRSWKWFCICKFGEHMSLSYR